MTITLRQESQAGTTTKNDTLTYSELDNNFIDLLTNKILPLQVDADTGTVTVGQAQQNGVFNITGGTNIATTVTEDSAGNANLTIATSDTITATDFVGPLNGQIRNQVKAGEDISKGQVVYFSGLSGNNPIASLARSNSSTTMPAMGIAAEDIANTEVGEITVFGPQPGLDVADFGEGSISFTLGDVVYVSATEAGQLTNVAPTGETNLIQNIGKIARIDPTTNATIIVGGAGRTNATPNLDNDQFFLGNGSNQSVAVDFTAAVQAVSINNVSEDVSPQLGGPLAVNGNAITGTSVAINASNGDLMITATEDGPVALRYDGNLKLTTKSDGVDITGELQADSLDIDGNADISGTLNTHTIPTGTGTLALTSDISAASGITQVHAGTGIQVTQEDSAGEVTITNDGMVTLSDDNTPELGGNLNVQNFKIVSTSAQNIKIEPDAGGDIYLESDKVFAGENNQEAHLTSQGTGNLLLTTNGDSSSGRIKINQGASGNIEIQPDGGGKIRFHNAYNMPSADGSNGQAITTDGFGNLTFTTLGGGVEIQAGTGINVTQDDSAGSYTISSTVTGGDSVGAGDNIQITNADSAGEKTISFNPNQPINFSDQQLSNLSIKNYGEIVYTGGTATGTITPDPNDGSVQSITLTGSITLNSLSSVASGDSMTLIVKQPASGGPYTLSSTMKFAGGTKTLSTTANAIDIITIFYDGTDYLASLSTNFS